MEKYEYYIFKPFMMKRLDSIHTLLLGTFWVLSRIKIPITLIAELVTVTVVHNVVSTQSTQYYLNIIINTTNMVSALSVCFAVLGS